MSTTYLQLSGTPFVLHSATTLGGATRGEFFEFCRRNSELRIERTSQGDLHIMPPTGGETGRRSGEVFFQLKQWTDRDGTGVAFDSSTGFWLPHGAMRSPDAAWVRRDRWEALNAAEREGFPPLAPDFVVEVRSATDRRSDLQAKLREYVDHGVRLAWLIDPQTRCIEVYRPGAATVVVADPVALTADPELPGFALQSAAVW